MLGPGWADLLDACEEHIATNTPWPEQLPSLVDLLLVCFSPGQRDTNQLLVATLALETIQNNREGRGRTRFSQTFTHSKNEKT